MTTNKPIDKFQQEVDARKQHEVDALIEKLKSEVKIANNRYANLLDDFEAFKTKSEWLDVLTKVYESQPPIKRKSKTGTGEAVLCPNMGDWHVLSRVDPEKVNNMNEVNPDIIKSRVQEAWAGVLSWLEVHRSKLKIHTMLISWLGDFINNMLYEDMKIGNYGMPTEEVLYALDLICPGIDMIAEHGDLDEIRLVCVSGNHARTQKELMVDNAAVGTYEWLMYKFMEKYIYESGEKFGTKITFQIANGYHNLAQVYDWTIRYHHGEWVRYQGGVGGLTIPMNKAIDAWNKAPVKVHYDVFGHWHDYLEPGNFLCNPSLIGYTPYSIRIKARYSRPMQTVHVVDSKRFITSVHRVYVDEPER